MNSTTTRPFTIALGLSLLFIVVLWLVLPNLLVQALDTHSTYYVAPSCAGVPAPCFTSIQAAVDVVDAPTDIIKVAAGTYTDLHVRPRNDITTTGVVIQVAYINKTLSIQGGYTSANWNTSNPDVNPSILDAEGQGRVIYIAGNVSPTISGLSLIRGNADGFGGRLVSLNPMFTEEDVGGGVYIHSAAAILQGNWIISNTAGSGGGIFLSYSSAVLSRNILRHNQTFVNMSPDYHSVGRGGAVDMLRSPARLANNIISENTANGSGGGLSFDDSNVTIEANTISNNMTSVGGARGGGVFCSYSGSGAVMRGNTINENVADYGGGIGLDSCAITLVSNTVHANHGSYCGGGVYMEDGDESFFNGNVIIDNEAVWGGGLFIESDWPFSGGGSNAFVDTVVVRNHADVEGAGIYLSASLANWWHTTIGNNTGGDGSGILVTHALTHAYDEGAALWYSTMAMTNTVIVGHAVGVRVTAGSVITMTGTLWSDNLTDWAGPGTIVAGTHNYWGDPLFVDPVSGDYHIGPGSAAIDRGVPTSVVTDIDNQPRFGILDLGADEYWAPGALKQIHLPILIKN